MAEILPDLHQGRPVGAMSCCAPGVEGMELEGREQRAEEIRLASKSLGGGLMQTNLSVPGIHCGGCLRTVEKAVGALDDVESARANLSAKWVSVRWRDSGKVPPLLTALESAGYQAHLSETAVSEGDMTLRRLIRAVAVAGFAAANIMLLSVSVWSGAEAATRDLFHWISALIALPALAYSGRIFFESAWQALRVWRLNMDVPISLAIILAFAMSLYETINHGEHAYFDAAATLMFFLLIGRTLDHVMRERARSAVTGLARLSARGAIVVDENGNRDYVETDEVKPGMRILIAAGERFPVDGSIEAGSSEVDASIATGESEPVSIGPGSDVRAGTLNLTGPLTVVAAASAQDSFLAEMRRLMEAAEDGRARYRRIADRAAEIYAPAVHLAAAVTFVVWFWFSGDLHRSIYTAIAVLIITCPCALGLAVPVVQVVAARRLFEQGIMVKDGGALERIAECSRAIFDKTGTLTLDKALLLNADQIDPDSLKLASAMASGSRHPYSRAIADALPDAGAMVEELREFPGHGLEGMQGSSVVRLGRPEWALDDSGITAAPVVLSRDGKLMAQFEFSTAMRPDAASAIAALKSMGVASEVLSGDRTDKVQEIADAVGAESHAGQVLPDEKLARLQMLQSRDERVLMVGDGINDAPALSAAHASMAPATAADIGRSASGFIFLRESLMAVPFAVDTARRAAGLVRQNFAIAIVYNLIAVPAAAFGYVTPLIAALAMSGSSIVVIANALRLNQDGHFLSAGERNAAGSMNPASIDSAGVPAE